MRSVLLALGLFFASSCVAFACSLNVVHIRGDFGQARFNVELADDDAERAQGLMFREEMARSSGMLFIYEHPQRLSFWMRNTLIELDMLFIDPTGVVRHIHHRAKPLDETPITGGDGLMAVLEVNGGLAKALGISVGSQLRHPAFEKGPAAWAC
ncbi:MAG: DUF192 domain-containing protein [Pseudomonadota bacterium]